MCEPVKYRLIHQARYPYQHIWTGSLAHVVLSELKKRFNKYRTVASRLLTLLLEGAGEGASEAPRFFVCLCQTAWDRELKLSYFKGAFIANILWFFCLDQGQVRSPGQVSWPSFKEFGHHAMATILFCRIFFYCNGIYATILGGGALNHFFGFAWGAWRIIVPYASVSRKTVVKFRFDVFSIGSQNLNIICQGQKSLPEIKP